MNFPVGHNYLIALSKANECNKNGETTESIFKKFKNFRNFTVETCRGLERITEFLCDWQQTE